MHLLSLSTDSLITDNKKKKCACNILSDAINLSRRSLMFVIFLWVKRDILVLIDDVDGVINFSAKRQNLNCFSL